MTQLTEKEAPAVQITPAAMLQLAASQQVDPDKLQKLMDFAERYQANQARAAFNQSMAKFKQAPPRIAKNKHVKFGNTEYDHATLDNVTDVITEALSKVGIRHRWQTEQRDGKIIVTCILSHEMGHSESTPLEASADTSGSKNAIQAIASAVTYLQRYTLLAATGMATGGMDDDGQAAGGKPEMPAHEYQEWCEAIHQAPSLVALKKVFADGYKAAEGYRDNEAMKNLIRAKDEAKKGMQ